MRPSPRALAFVLLAIAACSAKRSAEVDAGEPPATGRGDDDGGPMTARDAADDATSPPPDAAPPACPPNAGDGPLGGARPAPLKVPAGYTPTKRYPLVLELHGRGADGAAAESVFQMGALADKNGVFVIAPTGTLDTPPAGTAPATFWNATDACCNLYGSSVDDVAYLRSLICHTQARYAIDPNKVFIIGGSNGGFMAHRMGCDAADLVTAIISLSGVTFLDPAKCRPSHPVSMLQIHGTADDTVPFDGSPKLFPGASPGARATYDTWAAKNGCTGDDVAGPTIDFDKNVAGSETATVRKAVGGSCAAATELWTVNGGGHAMNIASSTKQFFLDWLLATPPNHP